MFSNTQDLSDFSQQQFDKAVRLSSIVLTSMERFTHLQLDLSRKLMSENTQMLKSLSEAKDPKCFTEAQSNLLQPSIDQVFAAARHVYDAALDTQQELSSFMEDQIAANKTAILAGFDRLSKNTPPGYEVVLSALKTIFNTSSTAIENVSKTAKKVSAEIAEASVQAATNSAKAATAAMNRGKKAATAA